LFLPPQLRFLKNHSNPKNPQYLLFPMNLSYHLNLNYHQCPQYPSYHYFLMNRHYLQYP
jgi:hypothetical protein